MKKFVAIIFPLFLLTSCTKEKTYKAAGILTGVDFSLLCPCCGGVILAVDNAPGDFRIDSLPFISVQQLYNLRFPKRIKFNYSNKNNCGGIKRLTITEYFMK